MNNNLIIFDLDGTLFKTESVFLPAIQKVIEEMNLSYPGNETIKAHFGERSEAFYAKLFPNFTKEAIEEIAYRVRTYERNLLASRGGLYPGVRELLNELCDMGYTLALCSNGSKTYIERILSTMVIKKYFNIVIGKHSEKGKTALIKDFLEADNYQNTIMIGDHQEDREAAEANNIPFIRAIYGYGNREMNTCPFTASSPKAILKYVHLYEVFEDIERRIIKGCGISNRIIGVNGVDTSGKTEFSLGLSKFLTAKGHKVSLIHLDDFHHPSYMRKKGDNPIDAYIDNGFNLEGLIKELLLPITKGQLVDKTLRLLDLETDTYTNEKAFYIDRDTLIIVEGVLLYRPPIKAFFDYRIYLDISFDEVLRRGKIRDVPKYGEGFINRYKTKYIPIQQKYMNRFNPINSSHMVIDNMDYDRPKILKRV